MGCAAAAAATAFADTAWRLAWFAFVRLLEKHNLTVEATDEEVEALVRGLGATERADRQALAIQVVGWAFARLVAV